MNKWVSIGRYMLLKNNNGNRFDVIEVMHFGNSYLGAIFSFEIMPSADMTEYIKIADETDFKFEDDTYKLGYAKARAMQLEEAICVKTADNIDELLAWVRQWQRIALDD